MAADRLRITLVVHQFPPNYFTGTEQYVLAVGKGLQQLGHDVDVFALEPAFGEKVGPWRESHEVVEGLPVRRINFWRNLGRDWRRMDYRHPYMAEAFARHIEARDTDVVHCFHLRHLGADLIDRVCEQRRGLIVSLMDFWFLCPRVILMKADGSACDGPPDGGRGCIPCFTPQLADELAASSVAAELDALHVAARGGSQPSRELRGRFGSLAERPEYLQKRLSRAHAVVAPTRFLRDVFAALQNELYSHMMKEERVLFPIIRQLEEARAQGLKSIQFHCGSVNNPIQVMEHEHADAGAALSRMRELTGDFQPPDDACETYCALLSGLRDLETDLHLHIHKENNFLFPGAAELERSLGEGG